MTNPFSSPEQIDQRDVANASSLWPVYQRILASVFTTVASGFLIAWIWRLIGHEKSLSAPELRLWLELIFGLLLVCFSADLLRKKFLNAASVCRYVYGIAGTLVLSSIFVETFMAWYSGVTYVGSRSYVWLEWFNAFVISVFPIAICLHGISRRRRLAVSCLVFTSLVVAVNLRFLFLIVHADRIPSSWAELFTL